MLSLARQGIVALVPRRSFMLTRMRGSEGVVVEEGVELVGGLGAVVVVGVLVLVLVLGVEVSCRGR